VWAFDFQFDQTADGRVLKQLTVVDEFTREALVMLAERSIDADTTVSVLERLAAQRGAPEHLRMDNGGPELTAHAPGLVSLLERRNPRTSSPARRGRTRASRASTHACVTSCSTSRNSPALPKRS
jgi:integrase-like protein